MSATDTHPFISDVMLILCIAILFRLGARSVPRFPGMDAEELEKLIAASTA